MKRTYKDRRDKKLRRMLMEYDKVNPGAEADVLRKYGADTDDLHSAIREICSVPGPADNSRAAYRHEIRSNKERALSKYERRELEETINDEETT